MNRRRKSLSSLGAVLALFSAVTMVAAASVSGNPSMHDRSTTTVTSPRARLQVTARYDNARQKLAVSWVLTNTGDTPLAVFDRGTTVSARRKPLAEGAVADVTRRHDGDHLVLSHRATALPTPTPTVPPMPLAGRLDAGQTRQAEFDVDLLAAPADVRYCLGVAPFNADDYTPAATLGEGTWRASFKVVDRQTLLCTPDFDLDSGRFASDRVDAE